MAGLFEGLRAKFAPPVPPEIEKDFVLLTAKRLQAQTRLLYVALLLTIPTSIYAGTPNASFFVRVGLPCIMGIACIFGALDYMRKIDYSSSVGLARAFVRNSTNVSTPLALVCSSWAVFSYLAADPDVKIYYPLILAMGSFATAYCLSSIRVAAVSNLVIGILPITVLLFISGDRMNIAAAVSLLVASSFLLQMIWKEHGQLLDLLKLQRKTQLLAETDPLTGLLNRRAFDVRFAEEAQMAGDREFIMALIDLDAFKPVNDKYGHAAGDAVLRQVADRLRAVCGNEAIPARIGGDEFAILIPANSKFIDCDQRGALRSAFERPYKVNQIEIELGASIGLARWPVHGRSTQKLYEAADSQLYAEKPVLARTGDAVTSAPQTAEPLRAASSA